MEAKFKVGEIVRSKFNPTRNLVVNRYVDRIYYCTKQNKSSKKESAYFEDELLAYNIINTGKIISEDKLPQKIRQISQRIFEP